MRNESKKIKLENGWILRVTCFKRKKEFALGVTREEWNANDFSARIFLSEKATRNLVRTLQSFLDRLKKEGEKNGEEKKEKMMGHVQAN